MMKEMGLAHSDEISNTLIKAGEMLTDKLHEVQDSEILPDIKVMVVGNIRNVWGLVGNCVSCLPMNLGVEKARVFFSI